MILILTAALKSRKKAGQESHFLVVRRGSRIVSGSGSSDRSLILGPVVWLPLQLTSLVLLPLTLHNRVEDSCKLLPVGPRSGRHFEHLIGTEANLDSQQ